MPEEVHTPKPRICPHCGKVIPRLLRKPRDLGLLLYVLIYRVPHEAEITEAWIETARKHCRMKPERLAELRAGPHVRHWPRMLERRAARLAYFKQHGKLPPRWMGLLPGEPDHDEQLAGIRRYRKGGLAKIKARLRKHPDTAWSKWANRYLCTRRIKSLPRKSAALDDIGARLLALIGAKTGKLTLREFEMLRSAMMPENALPRRFKKKADKTGLSAGNPVQNAGGEERDRVPRRGPAADGQVHRLPAGVGLVAAR